MRDPDDSRARPSGLIGSAQRALRVLEIVAKEGDGITAKVVARRAGFKLSTTYHLLNTLVHEGYLVRLSHARGFGIGYKVVGLYQQLCQSLSIVPSLEATLDDIHQRARAAAYYTVFRDNEIVVAAVADSPAFPRVRPLEVGVHEAVHTTAFGKVLLASLSTSERRSYLTGTGLPKLTPRTTTRLADLESELDVVGRIGLAHEIEEFQPELACVGAPVRDENGRVAGAIAFSLPAVQFPQRRAELERLARAGAAELSRLLNPTDSSDT